MNKFELRILKRGSLVTRRLVQSRVAGFLLAVACCLMLAGCGNVSITGDALTAAQQSTMDAYQAVQRSGATATTQPTWDQSYLTENFLQWRFFVRSAVKDTTWGPKLPNE